MSDRKDDDLVNEARRRVLSMAKYVPPTVLGIIALQDAGCQPSPSCTPGTPGPCTPDTSCDPNNTCDPLGGGGCDPLGG